MGMPRKPLELAVADFIHAVGLLVRRTRAAAAAHELSLTEAAVISRLAKEGPATIARFGARREHEAAVMAARSRALEEIGLVGTHIRIATDGRQVNIET